MAAWMVVKDGKKVGPVTDSQLLSMAKSGQINPDTLIQKEGLTGWVKCQKVKGLFASTACKTTSPLAKQSSVLSQNSVTKVQAKTDSAVSPAGNGKIGSDVAGGGNVSVVDSVDGFVKTVGGKQAWSNLSQSAKLLGRSIQAAADKTSRAKNEGFAAKPYEPDDKYPLLGGILLFVIFVFVGGVFGAIVHLIEQRYGSPIMNLFLELVASVVVGIGMAFVGYYAARIGKIPCKSAGIIGGFFGGLTVIFVIHVLNYNVFCQRMKEVGPRAMEAADILATQQRGSQIIIGGRDVHLNATEDQKAQLFVLLELRKVDNFFKFVHFEARMMGDAICSVVGAATFRYGYIISYIGWVIELVLILWLAAIGVRHQAERPFCVACGKWKQRSGFGSFDTSASDAVFAVASGNLGWWLTAGFKSTTSQRIKVDIFKCPEDKSDCDIEVCLTLNGRVVGVITYPPDSAVALKRLLVDADMRRQ